MRKRKQNEKSYKSSYETFKGCVGGVGSVEWVEYHKNLDLRKQKTTEKAKKKKQLKPTKTKEIIKTLNALPKGFELRKCTSCGGEFKIKEKDKKRKRCGYCKNSGIIIYKWSLGGFAKFVTKKTAENTKKRKLAILKGRICKYENMQLTEKQEHLLKECYKTLNNFDEIYKIINIEHLKIGYHNVSKYKRGTYKNVN